VIDSSIDLPVKWQAETLVWMCTKLAHQEHPEDRFADWVNEAAEGDEVAVKWAIKTWAKVRDYGSFELEDTAIRCKRFLRNLYELRQGE